MKGAIFRKKKRGRRSTLLIPDRQITIVEVEDDWYRPGIDPLCHTRALAMTRGIYLLNEWWQQEKRVITYNTADQASYLIGALKELEKAVRELHTTTSPQQKIDGAELVFGTGATQIINALIYATSLYHGANKRLYVTHKAPGYLEIKEAVEFLHSARVSWIPFEESRAIDAKDLLEFVTTPNNPDGQIRAAKTNAAFVAHDRVNHWSLFLHEDDAIIDRETLEKDWVSIFSLSKMLSFSGARVGYAFVKEKKIADLMRQYIIVSTHGVARDGQFHCLSALRYLLDEKLDVYISWVKEQLKRRWQRLQEALKSSALLLLNTQGPNAWVKAPQDAEIYLRKKYNVEATYGPEYGGKAEHARINLLARTTEFDEFLWRITNL